MMNKSTLFRISVVGLACGLATACASKIDRFTLDRVLVRGSTYQDAALICATGEALSIPLASVTSEKKPPHRALVMSNVSAAMCAEYDVWEAKVQGALARSNQSGPALVAMVKDARIQEERAHSEAARRFSDAFAHAEAFWGPVGEGCPKIRPDDELTYMLGLYAGLAGAIHDKAGGGQVGVPMDMLGRVARGCECLDNDQWWQVPKAFQAAAWATLANSENGDPWQMLDEASDEGDKTGVALARAVQVMMAANSGRTEDLERGIRAHAAALAEGRDPAWLAFDDYANQVIVNESDLLWASDAGHRTPIFGELPSDVQQDDTPSLDFDPFADSEDPFGSDEPSDEEGSSDDGGSSEPDPANPQED